MVCSIGVVLFGFPFHWPVFVCVPIAWWSKTYCAFAVVVLVLAVTSWSRLSTRHPTIHQVSRHQSRAVQCLGATWSVPHSVDWHSWVHPIGKCSSQLRLGLDGVIFGTCPLWFELLCDSLPSRSQKKRKVFLLLGLLPQSWHSVCSGHDATFIWEPSKG